MSVARRLRGGAAAGRRRGSERRELGRDERLDHVAEGRCHHLRPLAGEELVPQPKPQLGVSIDLGVRAERRDADDVDAGLAGRLVVALKELLCELGLVGVVALVGLALDLAHQHRRLPQRRRGGRRVALPDAAAQHACERVVLRSPADGRRGARTGRIRRHRPHDAGRRPSGARGCGRVDRGRHGFRQLLSNFRSERVIRRISSSKEVCGSQPSWRLALPGSPISWSTSAGRRNAGSSLT